MYYWAYINDSTKMTEIAFIRALINSKYPDEDEWINEEISKDIKGHGAKYYEFLRSGSSY